MFKKREQIPLPPSSSHWPAIQNPHTRWPAIHCTVHWHSYVKVGISLKNYQTTAATSLPRGHIIKDNTFLSLWVIRNPRTGRFML